MIELTHGQIKPRYEPAVIAINKTQILIMGGSGNKKQHLSDILLFDTKTKTVTTEYENLGLKFTFPENQCALTS